MGFRFPNGEWVFNDAYFGRVNIGDTPTGGKKGHVRETVSRGGVLIARTLSTTTYPLSRVRLVADKYLKADFATSKVRGELELLIMDDGQAKLSYRCLNVNDPSLVTVWSSRQEDCLAPHMAEAGKRVKVQLEAGEAGGVKKAVSFTIGQVHVRDIGACWQWNYAVGAVGVGLNVGVAPFPDKTDWYSFDLKPSCPDWDGATINVHTRGLTGVIVQVGKKLELGINLPTGQTLGIVEESTVELTLPALKADAGTLSIGKLAKIGAGRAYLGS